MNAQNTIESLSEKTNNLWSTHLNILAVVKTNYTEFEIKTILDFTQYQLQVAREGTVHL